MQKHMKGKKGFTLVELSIVIAVIAILVAVLVPSFIAIIDKANESNDKQMVKTVNTYLSIESVTNGIETPADALAAASESGYSIDKLSPTSDGNSIVYDENTKTFALVDSDGKTLYSQNSVEIDTTAATTWYIISSSSQIDSSNTATCSYIITGDFSSEAAKQTVKTRVSDNKIVTTDGETATTTTLNIKSSGGISTYKASNVEINYTYDGTADATITLNIDISAVKVSSDAAITIKSYNSTNTLVTFDSSAAITVNDYYGSAYAGANVTVNQKGENEPDYVETANAKYSADGTLQLGTKKYPYLISSESEWISELKGSSNRSKGYYWKVTADLDFSETTATYSVSGFIGNIDFDNHSVVLSKSYSNSYLFTTVETSNTYGGSTISNLDLTVYNGCGLVYYVTMYYGDVTLSNIEISGQFTSSDNFSAPFVGYLYRGDTSHTLIFENCISNVNIASTASASSAVFLGSAYGYGSLKFDGCENYGTLIHTAGYVSMLLGNGAAFDYLTLGDITVNNCVNYGKIYGINGEGGETKEGYQCNLLCGGQWGSKNVTNAMIVAWVETNSDNLYNGEGGECTDTTFNDINTKDGYFDLDSLSVSATPSYYTVSFTFWVTVKNASDDSNKSWGSYSITFKVDKLSDITSFPAYSWISESALPSGAETKTITIGGTEFTTYYDSENDTTYYVFTQSYVDNWVTSWDGYYLTIGNSIPLTIYEYIGSSIGGIYTYSY
ncbi:MAG: type II secretion system GspH family protein [Clostridia bacterium]|nr:type II secretion system GspH family protein [Clostridia bacterium]